MSISTYVCRLFGGRDVSVAYDSGGNLLSIAGQSLNIASLPSTLQSQWQTALASSGGGAGGPYSGRGAFAGDNITAAVGSILDAQPSWRAQIQAQIATVPGWVGANQ
jgi:hypothetical protein